MANSNNKIIMSNEVFDEICDLLSIEQRSIQELTVIMVVGEPVDLHIVKYAEKESE